jgi:MFS family permease
MQIPAGWLVDHFDVKWVFAAGFLLWSTATAIPGILHGFAALIVIRIVLGVGESVAFLLTARFLAPTSQRAAVSRSAIMAGLGWDLPSVFSLAVTWLRALAGGLSSWSWPRCAVVAGSWLAWMRVVRALPRRPMSHGGDSRYPRQRSAGRRDGSAQRTLYFLVTWLSYLMRGRHLSMIRWRGRRTDFSWLRFQESSSESSRTSGSPRILYDAECERQYSAWPDPA